MNKYEIKRLIKALAKLENIDDQLWILSSYKEKMPESNYNTAKSILAMYNAKETFDVNYTKDQFKFAYSLLN